MTPTMRRTTASFRLLAIVAMALISVLWDRNKLSGVVLVDGFAVPVKSPSRPFVKIGRDVHRSSTKSESALFMSIPNSLDVLTSGLASIVCLPRGVTVRPQSQSKADPSSYPQLKVLYDVENNQACRKVREWITELDLVVETVVPAAPNSRVFTDPKYQYYLPDVKVPRLTVVESTGREVVLLGDEDILDYFSENFGLVEEAEDASSQQQKLLSTLHKIGIYLAVLFRNGRGMEVSPAAAATRSDVPRPLKPLILYSYEGNQFCRLVREVLTELDLPYQLRSAGKESPRRAELAQASGGSTQCPYLLDPNNDVSMAESADIITYLYSTYALWTPPSELLQWLSKSVMPLGKPLFAKLTPLQAGEKLSGGSGDGGEDKEAYEASIANAIANIQQVTQQHPVVIYTYSLSPFALEAKTLLKRSNIEFHEISLGAEWIPGLLSDPATRAALLQMTGQSSLPHIFVGGNSIGGLFSGTPGLVPALEQGILQSMVSDALAKQAKQPATSVA